MPIKLSCPNCKTTLSIPDRAVGKPLKCPKCADVFKVPDPEAPIAHDEPAKPSKPQEAVTAKKPAVPPFVILVGPSREDEDEEEDREPWPHRQRPSEPLKQRHGCLTAWLILMIVGNSLGALMGAGMLLLMPAHQMVPGFPMWVNGPIIILTLLNVAYAIALFKWQQWAYFGFFLNALFTIGLNFYAGISPENMFIGFLGVLFLFGVLQIGGKKSGWAQLDNDYIGVGCIFFAIVALVAAGSGFMIFDDQRRAADEAIALARKNVAEPPQKKEPIFPLPKEEPKKIDFPPEAKPVDPDAKFWNGMPKPGRAIPPLENLPRPNPFVQDVIGSVTGKVDKGVAAYRIQVHSGQSYNVSLKAQRPLRVHVSDGDSFLVSRKVPAAGERLALSFEATKYINHAIFVTADDLGDADFQLQFAIGAFQSSVFPHPARITESLRVQDFVDKKQPLTNGTCREYRFRFGTNEHFRIKLSSPALTPLLRIYDTNNQLIEFPAGKDDANSMERIVWSKTDGLYRVVVSSAAGGLGEFTLEVDRATQIPIVLDKSGRFADTLHFGDRQKLLAKSYALPMGKGHGYTIMQRGVAPVTLKLLDSQGKQIAHAERRDTLGQRRILYLPPASGAFQLQVEPSTDRLGAGECTLEVSRFKVPEVEFFPVALRTKKTALDGGTLLEAPFPNTMEDCLAWSGDKKAFLVLTRDGILRRIRLADLVEEKRVVIDPQPSANSIALGLYETGAGVFVRHRPLREYWQLDSEDLQLRHRLPAMSHLTLLKSPHSSSMISTNNLGKTAMFLREDLTGKKDPVISNFVGPEFLALTSDGKYALGRGTDGRWQRWRLGDKPLELEEKGDHLSLGVGDLRIVVLSADDQLIMRIFDNKALADEKLKDGPPSGHGIIGYRVADLSKPAFIIDTGSRLGGVATDPKSGLIYAISEAKGLIVADTTGKIVRTLPIKQDHPAWRIMVHPEGGRLVMVSRQTGGGGKLLYVELTKTP